MKHTTFERLKEYCKKNYGRASFIFFPSINLWHIHNESYFINSEAVKNITKILNEEDETYDFYSYPIYDENNQHRVGIRIYENKEDANKEQP